MLMTRLAHTGALLPRAPLALAALLLGACPAGAEELVGTWRLDVASLEDNPALQKMNSEQRAQALAMGRQMLGQMTLTFGAGGALTMELNPTLRRSGTYVVKDAKTVTTTIDGKREDVAISVAAGVLVLQDKGSRLVFRRSAAAVKSPPPAPPPTLTPPPTMTPPPTLNPRGKPIDFTGAWHLDAKATIAAADAPRRPELEKMMAGAPSMGITFVDGVLTMTAGTRTQTGRYTVQGTIGSTTVLESAGPNGRSETMHLQLQADRLHVEVDGRTMVFQRPAPLPANATPPSATEEKRRIR